MDRVHLSKGSRRASSNHIKAVRRELRALKDDKRAIAKVMRRVLRKTLSELRAKHQRLYGPKVKRKKVRRSATWF